MKQIMQPLYWNPARLKELKQRGYKLTSYRYDPRMREQTIEELENERASEQARRVGGPTSNEPASEQASDQASEEDSSNKR